MYNVKIHSPETLQEVLILKNKFKDDIHIIAGGTDLLVGLRNKRPQYAKVKELISLSRVESLKEITIDNGFLRIGSMATYSDIIASQEVNKIIPSLVKAIKQVGSPQIRNQGTIIGNICNASPAGDSLPTCYAAEATITVAFDGGTEELTLDELIKGPGMINLRPDGVITSLNFPTYLADYIGDYQSLRPRVSLAVNKVSVAGLIKFDSTKVIEDVRLALGAVAPTIVRATSAEELLKGNKLTDELIDKVSDEAMKAAKPIDDVRSTKDYRKAMVKVITKRLLNIFYTH